MDPADALEYIRRNHHAVLATRRADGTPQLSPVSAGVDDAGRVVVSTRETAIKTHNVRRHPTAWLCAFPDRFYGGHVQVEGDVEVVSLPDAMQPLVDYYRSIAGEHPDWDEYRQAMERDRRCLLRITVRKAGPDRSG
jgi:PPOX class probable F420-dependent enzyme